MDLQQALDILARAGAGETLALSDLTDARATIARHLHALRGAAAPDLEALTTLRESYFIADAAVKAAEAAGEAVNQDLENALSDIPNPDEEDEEDDEEDEEDDEEDEEEMSTRPTPKKGKMLSIQEAVARLGFSPVSAAPEIPDLTETTTRVIVNGDVVNDATLSDIAKAFAETSSRSLKSGKERVVRIETTFAPERTLSGKVAQDTLLLDSFVSPEAIIAAGGCCSLATPIYTNPVAGSTNRPIRDSLTTLGATRGKFTFYPAICIPAAGTGFWSCEDDELVDPEDPDTWKVCAEVECDEPEVVDVHAIYSCVTIGNYQARFASEQWQGYLAALAVTHARVAEVNLFTQMRAAVTTTHTVDALGSTFANLVTGVALAAAAMRQDQRLGDIRLNLWIAEWVKTAIRMDFTARRVFGVAEDPNSSDAMIATAFANEGVTVHYSQDLDPIEDGSPGQTDGALTALPLTAGAVLAPDGFFTYLDGGTLDLGTEIRDFDLTRQNKMATFVESYEGLLARGCNAKALDIPIEICDNASCPA